MDEQILQRYIVGDATEQEKEQILRWLEADSENMRQYMALHKLYDISLWQQRGAKSSARSLRMEASSHKGLLEIAKFAAVFALAFWIGYQFMKSDSKDTVAMQSVHAPIGQHAELTLADGSKVWLNAGSTLSFPTKFEKVRHVKLEGEGFFEVQADTDKPFIVSTSKYDIKALGTSFNVLAYSKSDLFETALLKGKVEITDNAGKQTLELSPDHCAMLHSGRLTTLPISHADYYLWREGIISFDDEPILSIIQKLELYFDVKMIVNNPQVKANKYRYTGKFRTRDGLDHILKVLQMNKRFIYQKNEEKNTIEIK